MSEEFCGILGREVDTLREPSIHELSVKFLRFCAASYMYRTKRLIRVPVQFEACGVSGCYVASMTCPDMAPTQTQTILFKNEWPFRWRFTP
jgi:hypothetical protein